LRYALDELETKGYISRPRNRGENHFKTVININTDRFVYWTRKPSKNISPLPTHDYNSGYVQSLQTDDRKINQSVSTPQYPYIKENKEQHACTRSKAYAGFKYHPIIYTLLKVLFWRNPERGTLLSRAAREIAGYSTHTGIDWPYWESIWQSLPKEEREGIARVDFLPRLRENPVTPISPPIPVAETMTQIADPTARPLQGSIMEHIRDIINKTTKPEDKPPALDEAPGPKKAGPPPPPDIVLTDEELLLLSRAKKLVKNRR